MLNEERTMKSERPFEGKILSIRVDTIELPNKRYSKREIVEHVGGVGIIAVTEDNKILLVKQYRKAAERFMIELPAGMLEPGEEPRKGAVRELEEETGYLAGKTEFLTEFYPTPGFCTEKIHLFFASDLKVTQQNLDETEDLEVLLVSLEDALKMVKMGEIMDAKTIIGITMYELFLKEDLHG